MPTLNLRTDPRTLNIYLAALWGHAPPSDTTVRPIGKGVDRVLTLYVEESLDSSLYTPDNFISYSSVAFAEFTPPSFATFLSLLRHALKHTHFVRCTNHAEFPSEYANRIHILLPVTVLLNLIDTMDSFAALEGATSKSTTEWHRAAKRAITHAEYSTKAMLYGAWLEIYATGLT